MSDAAKIEAGLRALLNGKHTAVHLTFNHESAINYATVAEYEEQSGRVSESNWVSAEEYAKAVELNSWWNLQWYPNTPVGSYEVSASSLEALLAYVFQHASEFA